MGISDLSHDFTSSFGFNLVLVYERRLIRVLLSQVLNADVVLVYKEVSAFFPRQCLECGDDD